MNIELIKEITYQDKKTLSERALKLSEETGEVAEAVLSYTNACGCSYKHKTRKDILEECTDVIIIWFYSWGKGKRVAFISFRPYFLGYIW